MELRELEEADCMIINELKNFMYDTYIKLLNLLKQRYRIVPFCELSKENESFLILRHDVDASLEAALEMARIENDLGITSTYFVLFSHKLYNLLEKDDLNVLRKISNLGHEIGLHYDVEVYKSYQRDMRRTLENEVELLEYLLHRKISSIACHNVGISGKDPFKNIRRYTNAYNPELFELYVSDSCRAWQLEDLSRLLSFNCKKTQLLIHPILWTKDVCGQDDVLERLFRETEERNRKYKLEWLKVWHSSSKVKNYENLLRKQGI